MGLLSVHALSELPPRRWVKDRCVALLATFALAFSGGAMMEARIVRTELTPAGLARLALLILLTNADRGPNRGVLAVGIAAPFAALVLTFRPIVLAFSEPPMRGEGKPPWLAMIVALAVAAILALFALPLLQTGLFDAVARRIALFHSSFPIYYAALALWFVLRILIFAWRFRIGAIEVLAVLVGAALGVLALTLHSNPGNAVATMNPFESMLAFAASSDQSLGQSGRSAGRCCTRSSRACC